MNELIKKLRENSVYIENCAGVPFGSRKILEDAADTIESLSAKLKEIRWIPCNDHLPEDPTKPFKEIDPPAFCETYQEYIVMIHGGLMPTTLYYAGGGEWYDLATKQYYKVIAWRPLPEPYKQNNLATVEEKGEES